MSTGEIEPNIHTSLKFLYEVENSTDSLIQGRVGEVPWGLDSGNDTVIGENIVDTTRSGMSIINDRDYITTPGISWEVKGCVVLSYL